MGCNGVSLHSVGVVLQHQVDSPKTTNRTCDIYIVQYIHISPLHDLLTFVLEQQPMFMILLYYTTRTPAATDIVTVSWVNPVYLSSNICESSMMEKALEY